jgi:parallel beta-helix repeat protein
MFYFAPSPAVDIKNKIRPTGTSSLVVPLVIYYVDAINGNDSNTGLSTDQAWKTVSKVNSSMGSFVFDDSILFRGGQLFSGTTLQISCSGLSGHPIRFGSYGTGTAHLACGAANVIRCTGSYIDVTGFKVNGYGTAVNGVLFQSAYCYISGSVVHDTTQVGIFANNPSSICHHIQIKWNEVYNCGYYGIHGYYAAGAGAGYLTVEHNVCHHNGGSTQTAGYHGIYLSSCIGSVVRYNECYSNSASGIKLNDWGYTPSVINTIDKNNCHHNLNYGIFIAEANCRITNNMCWRNTGTGITVVDQTNGALFANNTLVNNGYMGLRFDDGATKPSGCVFRNNIYLQDRNVVGANRYPMRLAGDGSLLAANNTFDNNIYCLANPSTDNVRVTRQASGSFTNFAAWQSFSGKDTGSITSNPLFVADYTNFHLQAGSPAIGIGATTLGIIDDYDDVSRGVLVDLGCFEFV